jgi:hypothetical protein
MRNSPLTLKTCTAILAAVFAASVAGAQNPVAAPTPPVDSARQRAEIAWLQKTADLYFSSKKEGLAGFECEVHPDWHALFVSANHGKEIPEGNASLAALQKVKVRLHARMQGGSTIEWVNDSDSGASDNDPTSAMLENMHMTVQQMLEGFVQFWSPFMEVEVVPSRADGLEITHTPTVHTIHAKQGATELTETFNSDLVLEHFDVVLSGTSIKFAPTFESTPQGMLVKAFEADIHPAGAAPKQTQKMLVHIEYQKVNNQTIPGQLHMEIVGTGNFNFGFDGCSTEKE